MSSKYIKRKTVAEFLTATIATSRKTQKEIADEMGYSNPNIITMFKQGSTQVPLKKVGPLARALEIDPVAFLRLVMQEYTPETYDAIEEVLETPLLTLNEKKLVESFRKATDFSDPAGKFIVSDDAIMLGLLIPFSMEKPSELEKEADS